MRLVVKNSSYSRFSKRPVAFWDVKPQVMICNELQMGEKRAKNRE